MDTIATKISFDLQLAQVAWVVKDIKAAERFFREAMGIGNFSKAEITRLKEYSWKSTCNTMFQTSRSHSEAISKPY